MRQQGILAYLLRLDEIQSHKSARPAVTGRSWAYNYVRLVEVETIGVVYNFC